MADKNMEQVMEKAQVLIEALPYIQKFSGKTVVIKQKDYCCKVRRLSNG